MNVSNVLMGKAKTKMTAICRTLVHLRIVFEHILSLQKEE